MAAARLISSLAVQWRTASTEFLGESFAITGDAPWEGLSEHKRLKRLKMVWSRYGASLVAKKKIGIDTTGDGKIDSWGIDTTGDGNLGYHGKGVDTTGDGKIDSMAFDTNGDGNDTVSTLTTRVGLRLSTRTTMSRAPKLVSPVVVWWCRRWW